MDENLFDSILKETTEEIQLKKLNFIFQKIENKQEVIYSTSTSQNYHEKCLIYRFKSENPKFEILIGNNLVDISLFDKIIHGGDSDSKIIIKLLAQLNKLRICRGFSKETYSNQIDPNDNVVYDEKLQVIARCLNLTVKYVKENKLHEAVNIHSVKCPILVNSKITICCNCEKVENVVKQRKKNHHKAHDILFKSKVEVYKLFEKYKSKYAILKMKYHKRLEQFNELDKFECTDDRLNDDLIKILQKSLQNGKLKTDSFLYLLILDQLKSINCKKANGMKWHHDVIRWSMKLHYLSGNLSNYLHFRFKSL